MDEINAFQEELVILCNSTLRGAERTSKINSLFDKYKVTIRSHNFCEFPKLKELMGIIKDNEIVAFDEDLTNAYLNTIQH